MTFITVLALSGALAVGQADKPASGPGPGDSSAKSKSPADAAKSPAKKPSGGGSLDEELFGDLAGDVFEGLDKPKLGKSPAKQPEQKKSDAKPSVGDKPPGKSSEKTAAEKTAAEKTPPDDFPEGEDLGQERNPLLDLGQRMRRAESLISRGTTGDPTQRLQDGIVNDLDLLIKQASQS